MNPGVCEAPKQTEQRRRPTFQWCCWIKLWKQADLRVSSELSVHRLQTFPQVNTQMQHSSRPLTQPLARPAAEDSHVTQDGIWRNMNSPVAPSWPVWICIFQRIHLL